MTRFRLFLLVCLLCLPCLVSCHVFSCLFMPANLCYVLLCHIVSCGVIVSCLVMSIVSYLVIVSYHVLLTSIVFCLFLFVRLSVCSCFFLGIAGLLTGLLTVCLCEWILFMGQQFCFCNFSDCSYRHPSSVFLVTEREEIQALDS